MDRKGKKRMAIPLIATILFAAMTLGVLAVSYEPGSENDPVVTLSYVEGRLAEIVSDLRGEIGAIDNGTTEITEPSGTSENAAGFEAVLVVKGSSIYFADNTQVILRSGAMTAIANQDGDGLADLTSGKDLKTGDSIQLNHLLLVPRNDGRGANVAEDSWLMINGRYTLQ